MQKRQIIYTHDILKHDKNYNMGADLRLVNARTDSLLELQVCCKDLSFQANTKC